MAKEDKAAQAVKCVLVRALVILEHNKVRHIPDSKNQDFEMPEEVAKAMAAKGYVRLLASPAAETAPADDTK